MSFFGCVCSSVCIILQNIWENNDKMRLTINLVELFWLYLFDDDGVKMVSLKDQAISNQIIFVKKQSIYSKLGYLETWPVCFNVLQMLSPWPNCTIIIIFLLISVLRLNSQKWYKNMYLLCFDCKCFEVQNV